VMTALSGIELVLKERTERYCFLLALSPSRKVVAETLVLPPRLLVWLDSSSQPSFEP